MEIIYMLIAVIAIIIAITALLYFILKSPYEYPYKFMYFDVSGKRKPDISILVDEYMIKNGFFHFDDQKYEVDMWKKACQEKIDKSLLKRLRQKQFDECLDDEHMFYFVTTRRQTRYRQQNYHKTSYKVTVKDKKWTISYEDLRARYNRLRAIDFEAPLRSHKEKNQRKLMTPELRKKIMHRDNYTCQACGKYMPDEVGLQIDHIIPISKGGKSVESNLQVLCSKCNGKKSNRMV